MTDSDVCASEGHVFDDAKCLRCGLVSYRATAAMGDEPYRPYTPGDVFRWFGIDVESVYGVRVNDPKSFIKITGGVA